MYQPQRGEGESSRSRIIHDVNLEQLDTSNTLLIQLLLTKINLILDVINIRNVFPVTEEAEPCKRCEAEGGDQRERLPVLCLRVHEGESLPAHEGQVRNYIQN